MMLSDLINFRSSLKGLILGVLLGQIGLAASAGVATSSLAVTNEPPAPIVVSPSQDWDGNDGPWSSFTLQVGTPPQDVKVFISTAATQPWVVVPEGCDSSDPSNCNSLRGGDFVLNQSTTWVPNLIDPPSNIYDLYVESNLGYTGNGEYGFDTVTLGWQGSDGPTLKNQTIAGIATKEFYLGVFGVNPRPSNFTNFDHPFPSYLENLRKESLIPSTSWGYTAGNQYRLGQTLGSLTLGGYDASKFIPNNISWPFNQRDIRDLSVDLSEISISTSNSTSTALQTSISILIDSTVPHIWLPLDSCTEFEKVFNLTWDNNTELYLLDDSQHTALIAENSNITFTLLTNQGATLNITLPYSAFDLIVDYPIVSTPTRYFPLKRALNDTQYTFGRTFLQETYLIADYDRRNFSVSQCSWAQDSKQDIIPILPPANTTTNSTATVPPHKTSTPARKSPSLAIIGAIIAAAVTALCLISLFTYFKIIKPRRHKREFDSVPKQNLKPEQSSGSSRDKVGCPTENIETDGRPVYEVAEERGSSVDLVIAEADGRAFYRYEMDVNEGVAIEMIGLGVVPELDGNDPFNDLWLGQRFQSPIN